MTDQGGTVLTLCGFDGTSAMIEETERFTEERIEPDEREQEAIALQSGLMLKM